jgi:acyl-CoA synthetase (NDP forming)
MDLRKIFYPESIALIGASSRNNWEALRSLLSGNFSGRIYPINPKVKRFLGLDFYPSVRDVKEKIDFAIILVPAEKVPEVVRECGEKGIPFAQIFSAGFSESGGSGIHLEEEIRKIARKHGVRLIGPNCMGVYCPESGVTYRQQFPREKGKVAMVSQSGGLSVGFIMWCSSRGIYLSKVVSYGNACDLDAPDFLEYLAEDEKTKLIALYMEGCRKGRRFFDVLRATEKPVVIWKAGRTPSGITAAKSHTGAISGSFQTWNSAILQAGGVPVQSFNELCHTILAFSMLSPEGKRVAWIGMSGGGAVGASDAVIENGLELAKLSANLGSIVSPVGTSIKNPVDLAGEFINPDVIEQTILSVIDDNNVDILLIDIPLRLYNAYGKDDEIEDVLIKTCIRARKKKSVACILRQIFLTRETLQRKLLENKIPIFPSIEEASRAIGNAVRWKDLFVRLRER